MLSAGTHIIRTEDWRLEMDGHAQCWNPMNERRLAVREERVRSVLKPCKKRQLSV